MVCAAHIPCLIEPELSVCNYDIVTVVHFVNMTAVISKPLSISFNDSGDGVKVVFPSAQW